MPTSKAYTGQRQDSGSGLDDYGARYYDALAGQFTSADTVQGPNRYAYVGGNPETATDPSGKRLDASEGTGGLGPSNCLAQAVLCEGTSTSWDGRTIEVGVLGNGGTIGCASAGCIEYTSNGVLLGQGQLIQSGGGDTPIEYLWGTGRHGDMAIGYSGKSLQAYIKQLQGQQDALQAKIDAYNADAVRRANDPNTGIKELGSFLVQTAAAAVLAGILCSVGTCAAMVTAAPALATIAGDQETTQNHLNDVQQSNALKIEIADMQAAHSNGDTVWFTAPTFNGQMTQGFDYVVGSGSAVPNEVVVNEIGAYLYNTRYGG